MHPAFPLLPFKRFEGHSMGYLEGFIYIEWIYKVSVVAL